MSMRQLFASIVGAIKLALAGVHTGDSDDDYARRQFSRIIDAEIIGIKHNGEGFDLRECHSHQWPESHEDSKKETLEVPMGILPNLPDREGAEELGLDWRNEAKAEGEGWWLR